MAKDDGEWEEEKEKKRLAALDELGMLYTPREERFDAITRLVSRHFDVPIAMISLVGDRQVWLKSEVGLEGIEEVPREISFCDQAIREPQILVVEDATLDERFRDSPLVTGEAGLRFYAGAVIHSAQRTALGVVCIIDRKPRQMSYRDRRQLIDFAAYARREMSRADGRTRALSSAQTLAE